MRGIALKRRLSKTQRPAIEEIRVFPRGEANDPVDGNAYEKRRDEAF